MFQHHMGDDIRALSQESGRLRQSLLEKTDGAPHRNTFFITRDEIEKINFQMTAMQILLEKMDQQSRQIEQLTSGWDTHLAYFHRPAGSI